jgi:tyrosine-protein kinase Etk/Wzc
VPMEDQQSDVPASHSSRASLPPVVRVAIKRRKLIGIIALSIALLALVVALVLPNRYTATVVILPPQQNDSPGAAMMAQLGSLGAMAGMGASSLGIKNPNDLQVALLKSNTVEKAMVARFHLQELYHSKYLSSACKRWEKQSKAENGLKDGLIRLSVTDHDPRKAAELANGWVEEYRQLLATLAVSEASRRRLFFVQQLDNARGDLAHAEEEMKQTQQRTGVVDIDGQTHAMIASAAMLRAQVASKQVEIQAMRQFAAAGNPDLERAQQELSGLQGQLSSMDADRNRPGGDLAAPKGNLSQSGLEYERALREVKYRETVVELLTRQYEMARVDEARQGSQIQVVDAASVPDHPASLFRFWIVLGGIFLSLPIAFGIALLVEVSHILRKLRRRLGSWSLVLEEVWCGEAQ